MFDIKDFYLSISKELLSDVLTFAETIIYLDNHVRRLNTAPINRYFSIKKKRRWKKRSDLFDASMDAHDGAEVHERVVFFY